MSKVKCWRAFRTVVCPVSALDNTEQRGKSPSLVANLQLRIRHHHPYEFLELNTCGT